MSTTDTLLDFARVGADGNPVVARSAIAAVVTNEACGTVVLRLHNNPSVIVNPGPDLIMKHPDFAERAVALRGLVLGLIAADNDAESGHG